MIIYSVVSVECLDRFLGTLEYFLELLLLLIHFLFIFLSLSLYFFQPFRDHIINIPGFLVDDPSILNLFGFKFILIFFKESVNLCVFDHLGFNFLYFNRSWPIKKVFKLTCLFDCSCILFYLVLYLLKLLQLLDCRLNNSVGNDFLESASKFSIFSSQIVANLFSLDLK